MEVVGSLGILVSLCFVGAPQQAGTVPCFFCLVLKWLHIVPWPICAQVAHRNLVVLSLVCIILRYYQVEFLLALEKFHSLFIFIVYLFLLLSSIYSFRNVQQDSPSSVSSNFNLLSLSISIYIIKLTCLHLIESEICNDIS